VQCSPYDGQVANKQNIHSIQCRPTAYQRLLTCYTVCQPECSGCSSWFWISCRLSMNCRNDIRVTNGAECNVLHINYETMQYTSDSAALLQSTNIPWHLVLCLHDGIPARQKQTHNLQRASSIVREGVLMQCPLSRGDSTSHSSAHDGGIRLMPCCFKLLTRTLPQHISPMWWSRMCYMMHVRC
jgi:hypothetical protein